MCRRCLTDSSSSEYALTYDSSSEHAPADIEIDQYSSSNTELTDIDDDVYEVNLVDKVDRSDDIEDAEEVKTIDCAYLPTDEVTVTSLVLVRVQVWKVLK
jgi:hypothetical protein